MSDAAVIIDGVWKRFRLGQTGGSLRDAAGHLMGRLLRRGPSVNPDDFWALRNVTIEARPGEVLGIIGPNGAGKSTLLKLLCGILKPDRGRIEARGRLSALIEVGAGFHPELTGRENVYLNGSILGMSRAEIARKLDAIVDFAGLAEFIDTPIKRYSSGMVARLGFSVAAQLEPDVLLVDEVLSVGDFAFQIKCFRRMNEIRQRGTTVVFVSHNMQAVSTLCDRVVVLRRGEILCEASPEIATRRYLEAMAEQQCGVGSSSTQQKVTVESAELLDHRGQPTQVVQPGERCRVRLRLRANQDLPDAGLSLRIIHDDQTAVFDQTTAVAGDFFDFRKGDVHQAIFDLTANLAAGPYAVGLNVYNHRTMAFYCWDDTVMRFSVPGKRLTDNLVHMDWSYRIEPCRQDDLVIQDAAANDAAPRPLVSVVMPCYNAERFLAEAVDDVLGQTYEPVELIVIDDGSTDRSPDIAASYGPALKLIRQPNVGCAAARNAGIQQATGEYVAFLDADDRWDRRFIETMMHALCRQAGPDEAPAAELAYCGWARFFSEIGDGKPFVPRELEGQSRGKLELMLEGCPFPIHAVVVRRQRLLEAGLFDQRFPPAEDYHLWLRLAMRCRFARVPEVMAYYRRHATQQTATHFGPTLKRWRMLRDLVRTHRDAFAGIPAPRLDQLVHGVFRREGFNAYWRGDLVLARQCFRAMLRTGRVRAEDLKVIAPSLLPLRLHEGLLSWQATASPSDDLPAVIA